MVVHKAERRVSRQIAQALGTMIEQLLVMGPDRRGVIGGLDGVDPATPAIGALRLTLRQAVAAVREVDFDCRLADGTVAIDQRVVPETAIATVRPLTTLVARLRAVGAASLQIRYGVSAGELLLLARYLAQPPGPVDFAALLVGDIGTPLESILSRALQPGGRETMAVDDGLLRTWSLALLPTRPPYEPDPSIAAKLQEVRGSGPAESAVASLRADITAAVAQQDAVALETLVVQTVLAAARRGTGAGRLGLEAVLRALLHPSVIGLVAQRVPMTRNLDALCAYFSRAGKVGAATLMRAAIGSEDPDTRRAYVDALVATRVVPDELAAALQDPRPEAMRTAIGLIAELGGPGAELPLLGLVKHDDPSVRLAVVGGLVRMQTGASLAAVQLLVNDAALECRRLAALAAASAAAAGSGVARPSAVPFLAALDLETDADVRLELVLALGRIASSDAIQRLMRLALAAPGSTDSRDPVLRITALDGLIRARGGQARSVIKTLEADADLAVVAAAKAHRSALPE
ncbi:MAG: HEAT repeat domain-containing protein [Gemmatimonadaceae bacterium]